jgi:ribonuclease H / adenosylcobalamin/alpha-ribazole phosphatase
MLVRHAAHSHLGSILSGRTPGIALSAEGRSQAGRLAQHCAGISIDRIQSSPVQRARETAAAIFVGRDGLEIELVPELDELDFGEWSGRSFVELARDPEWRDWNGARANAIAPGGESMAAAQARTWAHIEKTATARPGETIVMVTHCDIIRAVIAHVLGLSLDHILRFDIDPASVSRLAVGSWGAKVLTLNERCS